MTFEVKEAALRGIFDSRGRITTEANMILASRMVGRGSSPRAIMPGRFERPRGQLAALGPKAFTNGAREAVSELCGREYSGQTEFDSCLSDQPQLGTTISVALSLAFARAAAAQERMPLHLYLSRKADGDPSAKRFPRPLINVVSGGIHACHGSNPFQQIFLIPRCEDLFAAVEATKTIYDKIEKHFAEIGDVVYSASSGMIAKHLDHVQALDLISDTIETASLGNILDIGFDVAAEHLLDEDGLYRVNERRVTADVFLSELTDLIATYPIGIVEDPFDPDHVKHWRNFIHAVGSSVNVIGDDLFASDATRIDPTLANGVVLKLDQIGTITGLLDTARRADECGMSMCQSHRSGETEDTSMCDIAVAVGADFIKIGGLRRGDRIIKINQLLRLREHVDHEKNGRWPAYWI